MYEFKINRNGGGSITIAKLVSEPFVRTFTRWTIRSSKQKLQDWSNPNRNWKTTKKTLSQQPVPEECHLRQLFGMAGGFKKLVYVVLPPLRPHPVFRAGPKLIGATTLVGASMKPLTRFGAWWQSAEFANQ
jgi:hypothetical protein